MDIDDEDDFYAPEEPQAPAAQPTPPAPSAPAKKDANDELEEGEEEDEGGAMDEDDDSDIDIITERKDGSKPAPAPQSRYSEIKNIPQRSASSDGTTKPAPVKRESPRQQAATTADYPPVSTSKIDVNAIPIHKPSGKPITQVNIDEDLPADNDKPWRKPGTDLSDYFNYGFDEFTWALYAQKQEALRAEYNPEAIAQSNKKMMEDMTNMMMMSGIPMPGAAPPGAAGGAAAGQPMPGMEGVSPELQAMMQQMMASGMDPSQMDMSAMAGMFGGAGAGAGAGQAGQGPGFGDG
ncbi:2a8508b2-eaf7-4dab-a09e-68c8be849fe6 [Thermothielavioides terrestris]|uniref:2a8508b2-eaf7-4dab-a09e-68c8be849fe6 n=1 Tax=Thermothielavioides terrestris TaxID=2587410 RepID=A0A3S4AR96_9PEZI|nr:2a8508b2-eaf7-4dab-a09e-68c8be849fe6 [Thermothielavioides terrestris]